MSLYTAHAPTPSLTNFALECVPVSWASQLLKLVLNPQACSKLEAMRIQSSVWDGRCAELGLRVTEVLRLAGALKTFECMLHLADGDPIHDAVPRLTTNTSLTRLIMNFHSVYPSLPMIRRGLGTLLSDIRSPHVEQLEIRIGLLVSSHSETSGDGNYSDASVREADPPGSTSYFHDILSRSIFDQLPAAEVVAEVPDPWADVSTGVWIRVQLVRSPEGEAQLETATMSAIKTDMITLFAPWLDRGVVQLEFYPDPDDEYSVTRSSSSVLRVLGECHDSVTGTRTHTSIKEIQDSEDDEREGGARDVSGDTETEDVVYPGPMDSNALGSARLTSDYQVTQVNDQTQKAVQTETSCLGEQCLERQSIGHIAATRPGFRSRIARLVRTILCSPQRKDVQE
ncbi:uncharacterized protein B0H18DRAFT_141797 [Fomitopsis serialis]|uniref:uncharacterized protein n=1 Tax=Fomitopsis serialis TaxID=139415 RepID=UPI0020077926|nr:uncharacterized protein B0H18DRAFT_141797 [Neoantrodia serialis]KAH9914145.1 hypothetical protein B0H18DRAFT_141797 [Neoantrodia serialis]